MYRISWRQLLAITCIYHVHAIAYNFTVLQSGPPSSGRAVESKYFQPERRREDGIFYNFVTRPDIGAPRWHVQVHEREALSSGYWFVAPYANLDQKVFPKWNGPHIYDSNGDLIWSGAPLFDHRNTFDFRVITYGGKNMLSLISPDQKNREGIILDNHYNIHNAVDLRGDMEVSNMHDFTVVDDGINALTLSNVKGPATKEQSKVIGFDGECHVGWEGFKELRVDDNNVIFEWSAKDWIGLDECTFIPLPPDERCHRYWDILHLNSIDKFYNGDYLVSSRHMDAIYRISHVDGHVVWRLGGKKSDFDLQGEALFSRQHHARVRSQNDTHTLILLFDNANGDGPREAEHPTNTLSRGLLLALRTDTTPMTADLIAHYDHPRREISNSRGSMQSLPNGNIFMGWTYSSRQSEHSPDGKLLMEANFREGEAHSYRNYKFPWIGRPNTPPDVYSIAVNKEADDHVETVVYVSWNGATDVERWRLFKSTSDAERREEVALTERQGFETVITFAGFAPFVVVEALDKRGNMIELGRSGVVRTIEPGNMGSPDVTMEMQWLHKASPTPVRLEGLRQNVPFMVQSPMVILAFGVVCSAILICGIRNCKLLSRPSWWIHRVPLYAALSDVGPLPRRGGARCASAERYA